VTDPKHYPPGASWAGQPENTTGDYYRLTPQHIVDLARYRTCLRSLVEFIQAKGLAPEIEIDLEYAKELLAGE
jgi:hypothetical protein